MYLEPGSILGKMNSSDRSTGGKIETITSGLVYHKMGEKVHRNDRAEY